MMFPVEKADILLYQYKNWVDEGDAIISDMKDTFVLLFHEYTSKTGKKVMRCGDVTVSEHEGNLMFDKGPGYIFHNPKFAISLMQEMITMVKGVDKNEQN